MNKANMLRVADAIENENVYGHPLGFDMSKWVSQGDCGTVACVGGTCQLLQGIDLETAIENSSNMGSQFDTGEWLGLDFNDTVKLFGAAEYVKGGNYMFSRKQYDHINKNKHLVPDALRYMAESGRVSWAEGFKYAQCVVDKKRSGKIS